MKPHPRPGPQVAAPHRLPRLFWPALVVGWAVMGYGIGGMLANAERTRPSSLVKWLVGSAVVHDALIAPVVFTVGIVVARVVPRHVRPYVQSGLIVTGMVGLATFPIVIGFGRSAGNPSALPGNYGAGLLTVLAVVWAVVAALALRAHRRDAAPRRSR